MKRIQLVVLLLVVGFLACPTGQKVLLKMNFKEGKHYGILMTTAQVISQEVQGQKMEINQTVKMGFDLDVIKVDPAGDARIKVTYKRTAFKMSSPMIGSFEYDSQDPPAEVPPVAVGYAALLDKNFSMIITPAGKVKKVEGLSAMFDEVIKEIEIPKEAEAMKKQIVDGLKKQFGDEAITEMLNRTFNILPQDSITVGGSWTRTTKLSTMYPMVVETKYTLRSVKETDADLLITATVKPNPDAQPMTLGVMTMEYEFSGTMDGELVLDLESGLTKSGSINQVFTGKMKISGAPGSEKPTEVPINIKGTTSFEPL
ncbi:MAG TPA: hypothetical protein EYP58_02220 [bacterium (Candidatus Stahlbacteria)]|nr:hypothetical protein [Candidatus Stahlbacteria bacterium]